MSTQIVDKYFRHSYVDMLSNLQRLRKIETPA
jgi:hypothetical protein